MTDEVRETNGNQRSGGGSGPQRGRGRAVEQTRKTAYQAEMARLDLEERQGKLLPVEDVKAAMVRCGEIVVRLLERLPTSADEIAASVARDGAPGARALLKTVVHQIRQRLAAELRSVAAEPGPSPFEDWPKAPARLAAMEAETLASLDLLAEKAR